MTLLEIRRLEKVYPGANPYAAVRDFDLEVNERERISIIGHSGCGKSTVLSMIAGLVEPTAGTISLAGKSVDAPGPDRGFVFQSPSLFAWMTAHQNVALGGAPAEAVERSLRSVGLWEHADKKPRELSLGMQQRVGLARAIALAPKLLLLDEPFGMLDSLTRIELQDVLIELCADKTVLMVTHDVDEAILFSDRIVMMTNGPEARVGAILEIDLPRPRDRHALPASDRYQQLRDSMVAFLQAA